MTKEVFLPLPFGRPRAEVPGHGFTRDFEVIKEFEEVLLDVAKGLFGQMMIVDEPIEFARAAGIESDFDGGAAKGGEESGFAVALQIEDKIKRAVG